MDEALYKDTKVIAISGALPKDVTKVLKEEHAKKSKYKRVKLVVGGNQVKENSEKVADTIKDIRQTVKAAQDLAQEVDICELPPFKQKCQCPKTRVSTRVTLLSIQGPRPRETMIGVLPWKGPISSQTFPWKSLFLIKELTLFKIFQKAIMISNV